MMKKIALAVIILLIVGVGVLVWKHEQQPRISKSLKYNNNSQQVCLNEYYNKHPEVRNLKQEDVVSASHCYVLTQ